MVTDDRLDQKRLHELKGLLTRERERLLHGVRSLEEAGRELSASQGEESDGGGDQADVASDLAEQEVDASLERAERERLAQVDSALRRLAQGRYGSCLRCGLPINLDRLRALPWVTTCVYCAQQRA